MSVAFKRAHTIGFVVQRGFSFWATAATLGAASTGAVARAAFSAARRLQTVCFVVQGGAA